jgi:hypothetical protein
VRNSKQQKGNSKRGTLSGGKNRSIRSVVKTGSSGVKPLISSPSEIGVCWGSEDKNGWWEENENAGDAKCLHCAGLFSK